MEVCNEKEDCFIFNQPFSLVWKIEDFYCRNEVKSPEFTYQDKTFCLVLKANVRKYFNEDTYDIYLEGSLEPIGKDFQICSCIKSACDNECFSSCKSVDDYIAENQEPIWSVNRRELLDSYDKLKNVEEDCERITFESCLKEVEHQTIELEENSEKESKKNCSSNCEDSNHTESKLILKINNETEEKDLDFRNLHPEHLTPDFSLKCGKCTFHVHRKFLCDACPKFAAEFLNKNSDNEISTIDSTVLECFLLYVYNEEITNMHEDVVPGLHGLACKYSVKKLGHVCAKFWHENNLSRIATCELLRSAFDYKDEIRFSITRYILCCSKLVKFLDLSTINEEHRQLVYQVYRDYVKAHSRLFKF